MNPMKPTWTHWAESANQNKDPIASATALYFDNATRVVEIGSGTGQHAAFLAGQHPHLAWQPSERAETLPFLQQNLDQNAPDNVLTAVELDAAQPHWPDLDIDLAYSSNTLHIMSWACVCQLFSHLGKLLQPQQRALFYGPFRFTDRPFAQSNIAFDQYLQAQDPLSGIRAIDELETLGASNKLALTEVIEMPANNHILVWQKQ